MLRFSEPITTVKIFENHADIFSLPWQLPRNIFVREQNLGTPSRFKV
jgi:hypothetical protein